ncbi:hypothetical protein E4U42_005740 [Claviceps africana]|uniref:WSS1 Protein involved in sister chromatid separation and segregation n=1 Tax=Claviceps africana TaxID=83212 RepID=A0A8K0NLE9_9HYPO|nr:hypothetical protein E4U42_005740 [Claviceps africana]
MPEYESLVGTYVHLAREARAAEALLTLKKVASLVKPIMRARGWKVGQLAEFYPEQANLLGLNVNRGMKICLRLRYPGDKNQFLPTENVVDTMLHELAHIVHGPHNQQFHALWDQLRDECQGLMMKGYTGEGFLGQGHRLGGARMPDREIRRVAREAAEKRRGQSALAMGSGQRLGGAAPRPGQDIRQTIVSAVERRNAVLRGCGSGRYNDREIHEIADTATRNGFRTQAEEDEANEAAIAQALWELVQEDEKRKHGQSYVRPSAENPQGTSGGSVTPGRSAVASSARASGSNNRPAGAAAAEGIVKTGQEPSIWVCETCTLHNPIQYLCCDACGTERSLSKRPRPSDQSRESGKLVGKPDTKLDATTTIDLTSESPPRKKREGVKGKADEAKSQLLLTGPSSVSAPLVWLCSFCGTAMERQWWTCSMCGKMKDNSK